MDVGLAFTHVVHNNRSERNRLQVLPLNLYVRDNALPGHQFIDGRQDGRQVVDEDAQVVEDGTALINLHTVQQGRAMHHYNIGTCIHLGMSPFLKPIHSGRAALASLPRRLSRKNDSRKRGYVDTRSRGPRAASRHECSAECVVNLLHWACSQERQASPPSRHFLCRPPRLGVHSLLDDQRLHVLQAQSDRRHLLPRQSCPLADHGRFCG